MTATTSPSTDDPKTTERAAYTGYLYYGTDEHGNPDTFTANVLPYGTADEAFDALRAMRDSSGAQGMALYDPKPDYAAFGPGVPAILTKHTYGHQVHRADNVYAAGRWDYQQTGIGRQWK